MNKREEIYKKLIYKWLKTIQGDQIEANRCFSIFLQHLNNEMRMEICYDCSIVPVFIQEINHRFKPDAQLIHEPEKIIKLNNLIAIVKVLFDNLFIDNNDVAQIVKHLDLTEENIIRFNNSNIKEIQIRWERHFIYRMDLFWFVVAYKRISISRLILLYQATIHSPLLRNNLSIACYYLHLKKLKDAEQNSLNIFENSNIKISSKSNKNAKERTMASFDLDISSISHKNQIEIFDQSQYFE